MLLKQPTKPRKRLRIPRSGFPSLAARRAAPAVPVYVPHPMSLVPLPRCFRSDCRAVKKDSKLPCALCGALGTSCAPLATYTIYIEEY